MVDVKIFVDLRLLIEYKEYLLRRVPRTGFEPVAYGLEDISFIENTYFL